MAESQDMAHFPPGAAAPTAADRMRSPEHLAKLNEARKAFYEKPLEERRAIIAERRAKKEAKRQAREAKKNGHATAPPTEPGPVTPRHSDDAPPTVRSARGSTVPDSAVPVRSRAAVGPLRGLIDLCSALPNLGDGTCFIHVTRVKPTNAYGLNCAGAQKPIWGVMDDAEFAEIYGGAEYFLRGYAVRDDGKHRALTEPVAYKVAAPVNIYSVPRTEDDTMSPNPADRPQPPNGHGFPRRPGLVTPHVANAEATMHSRSLDHTERENERREARRREEKREEQEAAAERRENELSTARLIESGKEKEMERLERAHQRELELAQNRGTGASELVEVLKHFKPDGDTQGLIRQHSAELRQITEGHKEELLRLTEQQRQEIQRLTDNHATILHRVEDQARIERERADVLIREADKRASTDVKEAERRAAEQIREVERRSDARVADVQAQAQGNYNELRTRSEERIRDQNESWQRRFDDQRANAERELRTKDSEINLMRSNLEGNMQVVLAQKDGEIKRLQHDLREWKDIAEKNKDWLSKMGEFEKTAEAMGFSKGSGGESEDEDFKTFALKALVTAGTRLPELVQSTGELISKVRNPTAPPDASRSQVRGGIPRGQMQPAPRAMGLPPPQMQPLAFATEEGGYVPHQDLQPPRPFGPPPAMAQAQALPALEQMAPPPMPVQMALPLPEPQQPQQQVAPPPQQAAPVQAPPAAAPAVAPPPAPAAAAPPVSGPPSAPPVATEPSAADLDTMTATIIERFTPMLAMQFQQRVPAAAVAQQIIDENGVQMAAFAMSTVSAEQIIRHILNNPAQHSVLTTRNGQKFLRDIWSAAEKAVAGDGAQQQQ